MPRFVGKTYFPGEMNAKKASGLHAEQKSNLAASPLSTRPAGTRNKANTMSRGMHELNRSEAVRKAWQTRKTNGNTAHMGTAISHAKR